MNNWYWYYCLSHSGIKGQKWGERRYRNYDGTLTQEGKRRYHPTTVSSDGRVKRVANVTGRGVKAVGRGIGKVAKATGRGIKGIGSGIGRAVGRKKPTVFMSDDELAERIARLKLEAAYGQAVKDSKRLNSGRNAVLETLGKGGGIIVDSAFRAIGNTIVDKARAKTQAKIDEDKYERDWEREEERYQRDEGRTKAKNDALYSTRAYRELSYEDYRDMGKDELEKQRDRINLIREIEGSGGDKNKNKNKK